MSILMPHSCVQLVLIVLIVIVQSLRKASKIGAIGGAEVVVKAGRSRRTWFWFCLQLSCTGVVAGRSDAVVPHVMHTTWAWGPGSGFQNLKPGQRCGPDEGFGLAWLGLVRPGLAGPRA
ncbi:hypothetical protein V8E52_008022 [Russula decolorans]